MQRPEQFNFTDTGPVPEDHPALAIFGASEPTPDSTLVDILRTTIDAYPDMIALESPQSSLTYEDLRIALDAEATRLGVEGIGRGSRVGIRVPEDGVKLDLPAVRSQLSTALPGGITPVLCVLPDMPVKASGKVDRKALPWPLPATAGEDPDSTDPLPEDLEWLADRWRDQLGPVPLTPDADFFDLGGSSVAVAKLVTGRHSS